MLPIHFAPAMSVEVHVVLVPILLYMHTRPVTCNLTLINLSLHPPACCMLHGPGPGPTDQGIPCMALCYGMEATAASLRLFSFTLLFIT